MYSEEKEGRGMSQAIGCLYVCVVFVVSPACSFWFLPDDLCSICENLGDRFCREYDKDVSAWCYCDDLCGYYGDCCINSTLLPTPAEVSQSDLVWFDKLVCKEVYNNYVTPNISLQMIVSCDDEWRDDDVRRRCEESYEAAPSDEIQVIFTTTTDLTFMFKNVHCAICNGVKETTPLRLEIMNFEGCDVFGLRENLKYLSYTEALDTFLSKNCTYYLSSYKMEKEKETKRRCGWYMENGFVFEEGLGSLFDFLPDKKDDGYVQANRMKDEDLCPKYAYPVENRCVNFSFSDLEKVASYLFETEGHMELPEVEIYARAFLGFVERSYREEVPLFNEYQSLVVNWALTLEYGSKSGIPCTIVELDVLLYDRLIHLYFSDDILRYPCWTKHCDHKLVTMSRPIDKTECSIGLEQPLLDPSLSLENELSIASSTVSIVTLAGTITFCIKCPLYHNLPGRNSLSLMINLFVAHALFLSGIPLKSKSMECAIIGILLHWSWLTVFVWMSVCSFHTWFSFSTYGFIKLKYSNDKRRAFLVYNVIGYGVPSAVTGVCVILYLLCPSCKFDYGSTSCFISNPTMLGVAFAAPVGFLLTMNMIFFVMMIRSVQNLPKLKTNELSLNRNNLVIYLKLSLLIGFTWILGFVAEFVHLTWVLYLSILINGSQGLHLFWSHVCNRRAIDYVKNRYRKKDKNTDTETTTTKNKITKF